MKDFRLIAMAVLAVVVAGYAYYWMSVARPPAPQAPVVIEAAVTSGGAIKIGNEVFADPVKLKQKLAALRQGAPSAELRIRTPKTMDFKTFGHGVQLLQQAGVAQIGFINGQPNLPD